MPTHIQTHRHTFKYKSNVPLESKARIRVRDHALFPNQYQFRQWMLRHRESHWHITRYRIIPPCRGKRSRNKNIVYSLGAFRRCLETGTRASLSREGLRRTRRGAATTLPSPWRRDDLPTTPPNGTPSGNSLSSLSPASSLSCVW